jgi:hypothetical protein
VWNIQQARPSDAPMIASLLQEVSQRLIDEGRALWSPAEFDHERVLRDTHAGLFHVAREGEQLAGVMKFELEDAYFWPEVVPGTSAFIHKLAVHRAWRRRAFQPSCCPMPERAPDICHAPTFAWTASLIDRGCETSMSVSASCCTASSRKERSRLPGTKC